nr:zinc finger, CCHC-type [Tanacetum cinerariifolium]
AVVRLIDPKLKTLGERGIECIFVEYAEHSKAFRSLKDETEDSGGSVVSERVTDEGFKQKSEIDYFDTYAPVARISTIRLLIAMASIHSLIIHQMDVKTTFLNGELEEKVYMNQPLGFIMPGNEHKVNLTKEFLSSRFFVKDMRETDVILGIRIKHKSNGIVISQSLYIDKVLKKFNYSDCILVSTHMDTCEKLMPNKGQTASKKQTCITGATIKSEFVALVAASKEAEWLRNLLLEIPLWVKPIAPISIICDSATTLVKAYSQMYNGKSRHPGVRHSMIRELITNGVVSIEFVRSQQNLADHLTKGLARDLVINSVEGMGLKSNLVVEC